MANTRDLRRQIRSIKNTAQLTRAMKMVSAAKLRRAQDAMLAARPYSQALRQVLADVALRAHPDRNPLLMTRPLQRVDLFVLTSDKGMAGAFNANALRAAEAWRQEKEAQGVKVELTLIGRKAVDFYRRRPGATVRRGLPEVFKTISFVRVQEFATELEERFVTGQTDACYIAYNQFRNVASQKVVVEPLLPIVALTGHEIDAAPREGVEFLYEPDADELLAHLLSRFVAFEMYHAALESVASEHGARMSAMDNATRNANELMNKMTLQMNRIRQAAITKEIIEVVSGAEALG